MMIEFQFVKNGLLKEEHCIITTFEDNIQIIKNEMEDSNIDVEALRKRIYFLFIRFQIQ